MKRSANQVLGHVETINKYSRKTAIVQTGWRTQSVCITIGRHQCFGSGFGLTCVPMQIISLIALAIVGTCIVLLIVAKIDVE